MTQLKALLSKRLEGGPKEGLDQVGWLFYVVVRAWWEKKLNDQSLRKNCPRRNCHCRKKSPSDRFTLKELGVLYNLCKSSNCTKGLVEWLNISTVVCCGLLDGGCPGYFKKFDPFLVWSSRLPTWLSYLAFFSFTITWQNFPINLQSWPSLNLRVTIKLEKSCKYLFISISTFRYSLQHFYGRDGVSFSPLECW